VLAGIRHGFPEWTSLKKLPLQVPLESGGRPHIVSAPVNHSMTIGAYDNHVLLRVDPRRRATGGDRFDVMNLNKAFSPLPVPPREIEAAHHVILTMH
jgi:hypothetical protein